MQGNRSSTELAGDAAVGVAVDRSGRAEQLRWLTETTRGTPMGDLLRRFWQPVALSRELAPGKAMPVRILGDTLTLYRGASGKAYLLAGQCRHRGTVLHTGWVEGERIRCMYHGWQFDGSGACTERPAERESVPPPQAAIAAYPAQEYCGLIFAWLGEGAAPAFDLPRKAVCESGQPRIVATREDWDMNWFQQIENSLDPTHVSFAHRTLRVGAFGAAVTNGIPELSYIETEAGLEQTATRAADNVRKSDWTFPNNNHVVVPGLTPDDPWIDFIIWMVPQDDIHATRFTLYVMASHDAQANQRFDEYFQRYGSYNAAEHRQELFLQARGPEEADKLAGLISAQDYLAQRGQGRVANRADELLGRSDLGVVTLRRLFWRELQALREGRPTKHWRRRPDVSALPIQPGDQRIADV